MNPNGQESWGTRVGVILAVTGSAVGLGNFLRFPGLASQYNTGAFMIPYIIAFLLVGLPIAWAEWAMGRHGGVRGFNSSPGIFRLIWRNRISPYFGVIGMLVPVVIYMYYVFIESWCLGYALYFLTGGLDLGTDQKAYVDFFHQYTGSGPHGSFIASELGVLPLGLLLACVVLNFTLIYRGLSKGIEWFTLRAMPLLILIALVILGRVLTLGTPNDTEPMLNVNNALGFMWNPDGGAGWQGKDFWASLTDFEMWLEAAGQIFFSLSVGFGVIITYSSYLKRRDDIALSSTTAAAGNEFCEVALGGMIIIPAAFLFLGPLATAEAASGSSFGLGFVTLPLVFQHMPAGHFFGFLFFFLLFLAAVTSSISMLQPAIAFLEEGLGLDRKGSVALLGFVTLIGTAFVVYFNEGFTALDTMDFWVGTFCIYILATFQIILFGWVLGTKKGMAELDNGAEIRIPRFVVFIMKYVSPVYLLVIFGAWLWDLVLDPKNTRLEDVFSKLHVMLTVGFVLAVAALFAFLIMTATKRWNKSAPLDKIES